MPDPSVPIRATLAWISPGGAPPGPAFTAALRRAGLTIARSDAVEGVDVAIVDFRTRTVSAETTRRLAGVARRRSPAGCLVYLAAPALDAARRGHLRRSGPVVYTLDDPNALIDACREELRARALAEEAAERIKSLAAAF
ncbi:MAG: hypothetical protein AAGC56_07535 [Pseudomonadota bacterium]